MRADPTEDPGPDTGAADEQERERKVGNAGPQRGVVQDALHVQGQEEEHGEESGERDPQRPDEVDGAVVERPERPPLGELIEDDHHHGHDGDDPRAPPHRVVAAAGRTYRRDSPPLLHATHSEA